MNPLEINTQTMTRLASPESRVVSAAGIFEGTELGNLQVITPDGRAFFDQGYHINFGAIGVEEVFQNVKYIILTEYFSVPLDREFGMDFTMVDKPMPVAEAMLAQELAMKIALYEPRCQFQKVDFNRQVVIGKLSPSVVIEITSTEELPSRVPDTGLLGTGPIATTPVITQGENVLGFVDWLIYRASQPGPSGPPGPPGRAATVEAGITETLPSDQPAAVENIGNEYDAIFDFHIPQGIQGVQGQQGDRGSLWFDGITDPGTVPNSTAGDYYLNTTTGDIFLLG